MKTFDDSAKALAEVATAAQRGDRQAVVAEVVNQGTTFFTGMPGLGAAVKATYERIAKLSAYGRMQAAVDELKADASEAERARKVGAIIAAMLREAVREAEGVDVQAALAGLEQRMVEFNAAIDRLAAKSVGQTHYNRVDSVSGGSAGIVHGAVTINHGERK